MGNDRRGFLKWLGIGGVAGAASILPGSVVPAPEKEPTEAFKYWCDCGGEVIAKVPEKVGTILLITCDQCHRSYEMVWKGDGFTVELKYGDPTENPFSSVGTGSIAQPWEISTNGNVVDEIGKQAVKICGECYQRKPCDCDKEIS